MKKKHFLPKLSKKPFSSKVSLEIFDEEDNTVFRLKKAKVAPGTKKLIDDVWGFKT